MPPSEPGYYFWRDRRSGQITRRSEWFVTKSPTVSVKNHQVKYLISFTLPRFCDQSLGRSRKERFYRRATDAWVAKRHDEAAGLVRPDEHIAWRSCRCRAAGDLGAAVAMTLGRSVEVPDALRRAG